MKRIIVLALLGSLALATPALAAKGPCTDTTEVTTFNTGTSISSTPATICGVQFFSTAANAFCQVYDSPGDITHGQMRIISEPGQSGANNADSVSFGDSGYRTRFGLGAASSGGRCIVFWGP